MFPASAGSFLSSDQQGSPSLAMLREHLCAREGMELGGGGAWDDLVPERLEKRKVVSHTESPLELLVASLYELAMEVNQTNSHS